MNFKYDCLFDLARNEDQTVAIGINKEIRGERGPWETICSYRESNLRFRFVLYQIHEDIEHWKAIAYVIPLRDLRLSILSAITTDKPRKEWLLNNIDYIKKILVDGLAVCAKRFNRQEMENAPFPIYYVERFNHERDYDPAKAAILKGEY